MIISVWLNCHEVRKGGMGSAPPSHNIGAREEQVVNATLLPLYHRRETRYPFYRRLDGSRGQSSGIRKVSPALAHDKWPSSA